ncbi:MAG: JAB domain-containing protein [Candidatus Micrarchaeota archaeon]|nr:JAB domain-containing protein [Candidatus Micrarchaeota archaeon]
MKIKDLSAQERPREKLIKYGPRALSNAELLAILIGKGYKNFSSIELSLKLLSKYSLRELSTADVRELTKITGIKDAKACSILAAFELGRRALSYTEEKYTVKTPEDVVRLFPELKSSKKEMLKIVSLDSKLGLISIETVSIGGLNTNSVTPGEVLRPAVLSSAAGIILVHNHPSGDPEPSKEDVEMTKRISEAASLLGIEVLDHIIIGERYVSMKESGIF